MYESVDGSSDAALCALFVVVIVSFLFVGNCYDSFLCCVCAALSLLRLIFAVCRNCSPRVISPSEPSLRCFATAAGHAWKRGARQRYCLGLLLVLIDDVNEYDYPLLVFS
jgi:hypothetical protein